jgi:hypothetical protein
MMFKLRRLGAWPTWRFLTSITSSSMRSVQKVNFTEPVCRTAQFRRNKSVARVVLFTIPVKDTSDWKVFLFVKNLLGFFVIRIGSLKE